MFYESCEARGKPSTWLPRGRLLEQIQGKQRANNKQTQTNKRPKHQHENTPTQYTTPQASSTVQQDTIQLNTTQDNTKTPNTKT